MGPTPRRDRDRDRDGDGDRNRDRERRRDRGRERSREPPRDHYSLLTRDSPAGVDEKTLEATEDTIGRWADRIHNQGGTHPSPSTETNSSRSVMNPGSPAKVDETFGAGPASPPVNALELIRLPSHDVRARATDISTEYPGRSGKTTKYNDPGSCPNCGQQDHLARFGDSDCSKFM